MIKGLLVAVLVFLVATFPATWLLMLFLGNVGLGVSYWGTLPIGILVSALLGGVSGSSMSRYYVDVRRRPAGGQDAARPVERQVVPRPVDQHVGAVAEADQVHDVQAEPGQPADEPAEALDAEPPTRELGDGVVAADRRHRSLVVVGERLARPALQTSHDLAGGVAAALDRRLGHLRAGQRRRATALSSGVEDVHAHLGAPGWQAQTERLNAGQAAAGLAHGGGDRARDLGVVGGENELNATSGFRAPTSTAPAARIEDDRPEVRRQLASLDRGAGSLGAAPRDGRTRAPPSPTSP